MPQQLSLRSRIRHYTDEHPGPFGVLRGLVGIGRRCAVALEPLRYQYTLYQGRPYFGPYMASNQTWDTRRAYMSRAVAQCLAGRTDVRILEIGTWAGSSALLWAAALDDAGIDGRIICIDTWRDYASLHSHAGTKRMRRAVKRRGILPLFLHNVDASNCSNRIFPFIGSSQSVLDLFQAGSFDMIYIDGDHAYGRVLQDIRKSIPLLKSDGILCGDDLELQATDVDMALARKHAENDVFIDPTTQTLYHPGVTLAVSEILGPVSCYSGFWIGRKAETEWQRVEL